MTSDRMGGTGPLSQTVLCLAPCDEDGYYLVQGLEAQSVSKYAPLELHPCPWTLGT